MKTQFFQGIYGEDLLFTEFQDGKVLFSSVVLDRIDEVCEKDECERIVHRYVAEGCFDLSKETDFSLMDRAIRLGKTFQKCLFEYETKKSESALLQMWQLCDIISEFHLSEEQQVDWFFTAGKEESLALHPLVAKMKKQLGG